MFRNEYVTVSHVSHMLGDPRELCPVSCPTKLFDSAAEPWRAGNNEHHPAERAYLLLRGLCRFVKFVNSKAERENTYDGVRESAVNFGYLKMLVLGKQRCL